MHDCLQRDVFRVQRSLYEEFPKAIRYMYKMSRLTAIFTCIRLRRSITETQLMDACHTLARCAVGRQ